MNITCVRGWGSQSEVEKICFYFGDGSIFKILCWGVPYVPKNIGDGPIK
jgi:hypothetical protein